MITDRSEHEGARHRVTGDERHARLGHRAAVVWFNGGLEAAYELERRLFDRGCMVNVVTTREAAAMAAGAGLISICVGTGERPEGFLLAQELEARGIIDEPFTGGAGI